jgi:hypothetical protein
MKEQNFITIAFCSIIGIAIICIATLFFMSATGNVISGTGQYYWAGAGHYTPEYGTCYCHPGSFDYNPDGSISGPYVNFLGSHTQEACINRCGPGHTYWKDFKY